MRFVLTLLVAVLFSGTITAQRAAVEKYIETYKDVAIREMKRKGVPASIILAQGILETESGRSNLVQRSNNHFGIKCKNDWTGPTVSHDDDARGECFRKYESAEDSYRDHSDFLSQRPHYASLFLIDKKDYKAWAKGLKNAGYATNPKYPSILISTIERYNLQQYTLAGLEEDETGEPVFEIAKEEVAPGPVPGSQDGRKAVFAVKGTSLLSIAINNNISLSKLMEYNDLQKDGLLEEDRWVYLQKKHKAEEEERTIVHEVLPKEGLYSISRRYNVSIEEIKALNNLRSDNLQAGQKLIISRK